MSEAEAWKAWLREAEDAYELAAERFWGVWISDHVLSEGVREAMEWMRRTRARFEERLTAYNAYMDAA